MCVSTCRELTVDDPSYLDCGGSELKALTCKAETWYDYPQFDSIVEDYPALRKLKLQCYSFCHDVYRGCELLVKLRLQELEISECPGMAYQILVPTQPFTELEKLCIWEDTSENDDFLIVLNNSKSGKACREVLDYRTLRKAVLKQPKLTQLSGLGRLFVLADEENMKGWSKIEEAPTRAGQPLDNDMDVWLKESARV